jgi:hypothetical protein
VDAGNAGVTADAGAPALRRWIRAALLCGVLYVLIGISTAALSRGAATARMGRLWRLAAWLLSAVVYAAGIWYEQYRSKSPPAKGALHVASGVAFGGFLLAAAATVRALGAGTDRLGAYGLALVAWPVLVGVPAFVVAWVAARVFARAQGG